MVGFRRRLDRAVSEAIEGVRRAGRGSLAGRAAAAAVVVFGDRLGRGPSARGKTFLVQRVLAEPVVFADRFGLRYLLFPSDAVYESFLNDGYYEQREQTFCASFVRPGMTVFDVGASHGYYTLLFAKLVGDGSVHAFEPEEWNFHRLSTNLALNGFENVVTQRAAIFERSGEVELNVFPHELYGWHTLGTPEMEVDGRRALPVERQTVPGVTLDDYCEQHGIERIDLLKLDVEGAELEALRGAGRLLCEGRIGCIVFEVSQAMVKGMNHDPAEIFDLVRGTGLTIHKLEEDGTLGLAATGSIKNFENFVALS